VGIFFHVQVNDVLVSFLTPPFSFGHEKNSFEYVMDFEKNWTIILHNKQL